jgi:hypothetical protein
MVRCGLNSLPYAKSLAGSRRTTARPSGNIARGLS